MVTPRILDLLDRYHCRAIFFLVGQRIPRAPQMVPEIMRRGHLVGNHTFSHNARLSFPDYWRDLRRAQQAIAEAGAESRFFRPPEGALTPASLLAPRLMRLPTLLWSLDSGDWRLRHPDEADDCATRMSSLLHSQGLQRDILLFHDDNPHTPAVLERILPHLEQLGADLHSASAKLPGAKSL